jgi:hypothetical protein
MGVCGMDERGTGTVDLTKGLYRRIYAGFITGKRISAVSMECEAFFWRLHAVVDDFGNYHGDAALIRGATQGRRDFTVKQIERWVDEMGSIKLLGTYESGGDSYIHILGFCLMQPAGRNGRRIRRFPQSPWDDDESGGDSGIRGNPGESSASHSDTHSHSHSHTNGAGGNGAAAKRKDVLKQIGAKR